MQLTDLTLTRESAFAAHERAYPAHRCSSYSRSSQLTAPIDKGGPIDKVDIVGAGIVDSKTLDFNALKC